MSDASLVARRTALKRARAFLHPRLRAMFGNSRNIQLNTGKLVIESFKLVLLSVWVTRYRYRKSTYYTIVNGQSGEVSFQEPRNWLQRFWRGLHGA